MLKASLNHTKLFYYFLFLFNCAFSYPSCLDKSFTSLLETFKEFFWVFLLVISWLDLHRYLADSPENCHLNVKKLPKTCHFFQKNCQNFFSFWKKNENFWHFLGKMSKLLAIFWQSNGNFPESQLGTRLNVQNYTYIFDQIQNGSR